MINIPLRDMTPSQKRVVLKKQFDAWTNHPGPGTPYLIPDFFSDDEHEARVAEQDNQDAHGGWS